MAEGKRYYWLKLHDDFFDSKRIKKLRRMAGGDTYTIIYLKLQLLAMKTEGVLKWTGLEDNIADELALDIDEEPDNVKVTLAYLLSCGLAETDDNINFFFPFSVSNVGSETSSAQRVREHRERQQMLQSNGEVLHCNKNVTESKSKREEIEIEIESRGRGKNGDGDGEDVENSVENSRIKSIGGDVGRGVIRLTEEQMNDLLDHMGIDNFNEYCKRLADWIVDKGANVHNHYATIIKWYKEDQRAAKK